jgi:hypothetical protein
VSSRPAGPQCPAPASGYETEIAGSRSSGGAARGRRTLTVTSILSSRPARFASRYRTHGLRSRTFPLRIRGLRGAGGVEEIINDRGFSDDAAGSARCETAVVQERPGGAEQPNKALQLTRRRPGACQGYQPAGGRRGDRFAGRPPDVSFLFTGGAQLSAVSVRRRL